MLLDGGCFNDVTICVFFSGIVYKDCQNDMTNLSQAKILAEVLLNHLSNGQKFFARMNLGLLLAADNELALAGLQVLATFDPSLQQLRLLLSNIKTLKL